MKTTALMAALAALLCAAPAAAQTTTAYVGIDYKNSDNLDDSQDWELEGAVGFGGTSGWGFQLDGSLGMASTTRWGSTSKPTISRATRSTLRRQVGGSAALSAPAALN